VHRVIHRSSTWLGTFQQSISSSDQGAFLSQGGEPQTRHQSLVLALDRLAVEQ
jgi:hypothetical protein